MQILKISEKTFETKHSFTLTKMINLINTYSDQKQWKKIEKFELQILKISERTLETEHSNTLTKMINLTCTYNDQRQWKKIEKLELQILKIFEKMLRAEHSNTLKMANLTDTYSDQGQWKEAEKLQRQMLKISERTLETEHPDTLTRMNNLAGVTATFLQGNPANRHRGLSTGMSKGVLGIVQRDLKGKDSYLRVSSIDSCRGNCEYELWVEHEVHKGLRLPIYTTEVLPYLLVLSLLDVLDVPEHLEPFEHCFRLLNVLDKV